MWKYLRPSSYFRKTKEKVEEKEMKEELAALQRLKKITPDSATLRLWAQNSSPPADLIDEPEERPW